MTSFWALVKSLPALVALINRILDSFIEFQMGQIDISTQQRKDERLALARAMLEATDDEQRKKLARLIYRLDHPV